MLSEQLLWTNGIYKEGYLKKISSALFWSYHSCNIWGTFSEFYRLHKNNSKNVQEDQDDRTLTDSKTTHKKAGRLSILKVRNEYIYLLNIYTTIHTNKSLYRHRIWSNRPQMWKTKSQFATFRISDSPKR